MLQMETNVLSSSSVDPRRNFTSPPPISTTTTLPLSSSEFEIVHHLPQTSDSSNGGFYPTVVTNSDSTNSFEYQQQQTQSPLSPTIIANSLQFTNSFAEYTAFNGRMAPGDSAAAAGGGASSGGGIRTNNVDDLKQQSGTADQSNQAFNITDPNMEKIRSVFAAVPTKTGAWNEFLDYKQFHFPTSCEKVLPRVVSNFGTYYGNYLVLGFILSLYCILTSPLLLVCSALFACLYYAVIKQPNPISIFGQPINRSHVLIGLSVSAVVCFFLLGITSVFFWLIGATTCLSVLHAVFHEAADADESSENPEHPAASATTGNNNNGFHNSPPNSSHPMTNSQFEVVTF